MVLVLSLDSERSQTKVESMYPLSDGQRECPGFAAGADTLESCPPPTPAPRARGELGQRPIRSSVTAPVVLLTASASSLTCRRNACARLRSGHGAEASDEDRARGESAR